MPRLTSVHAENPGSLLGENQLIYVRFTARNLLDLLQRSRSGFSQEPRIDISLQGLEQISNAHSASTAHVI